MVAQLQDDYTRAPLSAADKGMLDYVAKLTRTPAAIEKSDVEGLRRVGFGDRTILDVAQITAYFAFVTRIADGLGVTPEDYWT